MSRIEEYKAEIRRTFALVEPISVQVAAVFYPTLWTINPSTKVLFKNVDMDKQGKKLMKILGVAVSALDDMDKLVPRLQSLGRRHTAYGVTYDMYPNVRDALLLTLETELGPKQCTADTKAAWTWVLGAISCICIQAAKDADPKHLEAKASKDARNYWLGVAGVGFGLSLFLLAPIIRGAW